MTIDMEEIDMDMDINIDYYMIILISVIKLVLDQLTSLMILHFVVQGLGMCSRMHVCCST